MRFRYLAATSANERCIGWIDGSSLQEAAGELRQKGLVVVRLEKAPPFARLWFALNREIQFRPPISLRDLASLSQEWAGFLEAGISIEDSLGLLIESGRAAAVGVLSRIRDDVIKGSPLHTALARYPSCFPKAYVTLIQAGETAGSLGSALRRLADDLAMQRSVIDDVRNALLYPAFLLITALAGISTLLVVVVPNLESLFGEEAVESLPATTRLVIAASRLLRTEGMALLTLVAAFSLLAVGLVRTERGWFAFHACLLRSPVAGPLVQAVEIGRFTRAFGALLKGGVSISRAMPLAVDTVSNRAMRRYLEQAYEKIMTGMGISDALATSGPFPHDALGLIRMGERTGQLDKALERTAHLYEGRATRRLKTLTTLLTPLLTIGFGFLAGVIIYAMLSAILSINDLAAS